MTRARFSLRRPAPWRCACAAAVAAAVAMAACAGEPVDEPSVSEPAGEALERTKQDGPIAATVSVRPSEPRLGDKLTLTLEVTAEAGVAVEMPGFGDALGRFSIVDFAPRQAPGENGGTKYVQRYTLQSPGSGRQRIPPLRIEWVDQRGQPGQGQPASGAAPGPDAPVRELLTDELALAVASVLPEQAAEQDLRPARGQLEEPSPWLLVRAWPLFALGGALALVIVAIVLWRRAARTRARISAYDKAIGRLQVLERGGLPGPSEADMWFVELSAIVRRYLEDRFSLRAPELTTEEFLREARRSRELSAEHQATLSSFLALCDRVKFAGHEPDDAESQRAIDVARRFIDDTRLRAEDSAAAAA